MENRTTYRFDCSLCTTRCDGQSKGQYIFENDLEYALRHENIIIIARLLRRKGYDVKHCEKDGYPDLIVKHSDGQTFFLEVKAQRRTFMKVKTLLPKAELLPSETVALNLSDLKRYFDIHAKEHIPLYVIWALENRPCIVPQGQTKYFIQYIEKLKKIYDQYGSARIFRRKSGRGDIVDGEHKGVVVNYHFALSELQEWKG